MTVLKCHLTLCVDSDEGCPLRELGLDLLDPGQVRHEGGSGAGAEVDDQRGGEGGGGAEEGDQGPGGGVVQHRVRGRPAHHRSLYIIQQH